MRPRIGTGKALLEVLSDVACASTARSAELTQGTILFRANVLMELFAFMREYQDSAFVLNLGKELKLPWSSKLDPTSCRW